MALPLSSVSRDDNINIHRLSLPSLVSRAPFQSSSRKILTHVVGNRLPAVQKPRPLAAGKRPALDEPWINTAFQAHRLCQDCANVFSISKILSGASRRFVPRHEKFFLFQKYTHLLEAAAAGCHFCTILRDTPHNPPPTLDDCVYLQIAKSYDTDVELYVTIAPRLGLYEGTLLPQYAGTKFDTSTSIGWFNAPGVRNQPHDAASLTFTGSAKHVALAKSWLDECTTKHSTCRRTTQNKLLPSRFIQILQNENGDFKPRLYATSEHDQNVPYCALSHCWGGVTDIPLLQWSTINDFTLEGISFSSLPKSFQDAVTMTHALGIQYLWIDSLCIVQDSKEDWMRESAKMGDVYEYAACTIMSAAASDPHGGLFQHRESTLSSTPCRIAGSPSDGLFVLPHDTTNTATLDALLRQSPIQSRAWCFQESYLSPRKLYFGPYGIYWTCFTGEANELNPLGRTRTPVRPDTITTLFGPTPHTEPVIPRRIPPLVMTNGLVLTVERNAAPSRDRPHIPPLRPSRHERVITGNISLEHGKPPPPRSSSSIPVDISQFQPPPRRSRSSSSSSLSHDDLADFHATWMSIVRSYSARSLTKPSDRLVAVAGIASRLRRATGFAYAAGVWRETLLLDLMWVAAPRGASEDMEALVERAAAPATGGSYVAPTWSWAGLGVEGLGVRKAIAQPDLATVGLVEVKGVEVQTGREDEDGTGVVEGAVLWLEGKLKEVGVPGGLEITFERTATKRTGDLEKGGERMGYIDFDVKPPEGLALYVLPVVEHWDWSFSTHPPVFGLALVKNGDFYERVGLFQCWDLSKRDGTERWEWLHEGQSVEAEIL